MLLLIEADWPTQEGTERAWGTLWTTNGVLQSAASGTWENMIAKRTTTEALRAAASR